MRIWCALDGDYIFKIPKWFKKGDHFIKYFKYIGDGQMIHTRYMYKIIRVNHYQRLTTYTIERVEDNG